MSRELEKKAVELLDRLRDETISSQSVDDYLDKHQACFDGSLCLVCKYIEEVLCDNPLGILATNPILSPSQQDRLIEEAYKWQGRQYSVAVGLAMNPNVSDENIEMIVNSPDWFWQEGSHELLPDLVSIVEQNHRFRPEDVAEFKKNITEAGY